MAAETSRIADLKATLSRLDRPPGEAQPAVPKGISWIDAHLRGGLRKGALHEVYAAAPGDETAASGFAAAIAARLAGKRAILWIRQDFSALEYGEIAATGLLELGLDPARVFLVRTSDANDALRAASDALTCAGLGALILELRGEAKALDLVASRKLTLGAAQKGVSVILLRFAAKPQASTAETRWRIGAGASATQEENWGVPRFDAQLLRNRHGRLGHWVMEWNADDGIFAEPAFAPDRGVVVSAPADRPSAAPLESRNRQRPVAG